MIKTKTTIFKEIVDIMSKDYSGWQDKKACNHPEKYVITDDMPDEEFVKTVRSYLLDFQDHHVNFRRNTANVFTNGFDVRRYEDKLYVYRVDQEKELRVGDAICAIDGQDIPTVAQRFQKELYYETNERQNWWSVLVGSKKCTVQRENRKFEFVLKRYSPGDEPPVYAFKQINEKTCLLTLSDFVNGSAINELLVKNHNAINNSANLIIDVRVNDGGFDMAYFPLLKYLFPEKTGINKLIADDAPVLMNCTQRNCDLRIKNFTDFHQKGMLTADSLQQAIVFYKANYAKGFVPADDGTDYEIEGGPNPAKIYILSDYYCRSSGDAFVQMAKKSRKVRVIGRNTMGITDYSDTAMVDFGDYRFMYSVSKINGQHIGGIGVPVDVYIPWTPAHLKRDVDLEKALFMM
ncbi:MAG: S41 family peptidase [Dehalococcoidales bacterium]|nr:S41 family peptidase [Dehalococcoidales bacterium]